MANHLDTTIDQLELSVRTSHSLELLQFQYIGEIVQCTEAQLLQSRHFGRKSLAELEELLAELGLSLDMSLPKWRRPDGEPIVRLPPPPPESASATRQTKKR